MSKKSNNQNIDSIIQNTINNIKNILDNNVMVGEPITIGSNTIIPVTKVSVGIITGAGEMNSKKSSVLPFAGGSGSGFNLTPMGFVAISESNIKFIPIDNSAIYSDIFNVMGGILNNILGESDAKN